MKLAPIFSPPARIIEAIAIALLFLILVLGGFVLFLMPQADFVREKILRVAEVIASGLGVVALLFLWAQLRHTAVLNKLTAYHEYFHELPSNGKAQALSKALSDLKIPYPTLHAPLSAGDAEKLFRATEVESTDEAVSVRQYLNDFEEFAAAVRSGLIDEDYAYQLEVSRALNVYFGFRDLIIHWLAHDRRRAESAGEVGPSGIAYYGELRWLAERWRERRSKESAEAEGNQRSPISGRL